jgi:DeoR family galactitol utilization operon repressor
MNILKYKNYMILLLLLILIGITTRVILLNTQKIAIHASRLIQDKQIIFIESGSTTLAFAQAIVERIQNHELSNIVVFTNSLINMQVLSPVCEVSLVGGIYRESQKDFRGYITERVVSWLTFDYCILGADAISLKEGIMAFDIDSVRLVETLINRSKNSVVLADSSKFYQHSLISIVPANRVSLILTDSGLDEELYNKYLDIKANLLLV